jgi:hypothetical protein
MRPQLTPIGRKAPLDIPALTDYPLVTHSARRSLSVAARRNVAHEAHPPGEPRTLLRPPVIGYVALAATDVDLFAPARGIGAWCDANGWPLSKVVHDTPGVARVHLRRGLLEALDEVHAGRAAGLVVARLRDLADNADELGPLLRRFTAANAFVIALDYEFDAPQRSRLNPGTSIPREPDAGRR